MIVFYKALMNKIHSGSLVSDFFCYNYVSVMS